MHHSVQNSGCNMFIQNVFVVKDFEVTYRFILDPFNTLLWSTTVSSLALLSKARANLCRMWISFSSSGCSFLQLKNTGLSLICCWHPTLLYQFLTVLVIFHYEGGQSSGKLLGPVDNVSGGKFKFIVRKWGMTNGIAEAVAESEGLASETVFGGAQSPNFKSDGFQAPLCPISPFMTGSNSFYDH